MYIELYTAILIILIHNCARDFQHQSWNISPSKITDNSHHGSSWIERHQPWNKHNPSVSKNSDIVYKYLTKECLYPLLRTNHQSKRVFKWIFKRSCVWTTERYEDIIDRRSYTQIKVSSNVHGRPPEKKFIRALF